MFKLRIISEKNDYIIKINNNSYNDKKGNKIKKNLLIGSIVNYNWEDVAPFFKSFEHARFENCDCVIFVGKMSQITINKIKSCGVKVLSIPNQFITLNVVINNYRWKIYEDFLNENQNKYNLIFTADVRDSFFQTDIFKIYDNSKPFLGVALENDILTQETNKNWLIDVYGLDIYESIKNQKIICSGTVWGTSDKFREFSRIMWEKLKSKWSKCFKIIDQAVMNYLIYYEKLYNDCIIKSEAKEGPVMTMGLLKDSEFILDFKNNILNNKNEIISVIHQYDRKSDIVIKVKNKYCNEKNILWNKLNHLIIFFGVFIFLIFVILICCCYCLNKKKLKNFKNKFKGKVIQNYN